MDWTQTLTIIGSMIGVMAYFFSRIHRDIDSINSHIDRLDRRMDGHAKRIDQLYHMFCDLLKERK